MADVKISQLPEVTSLSPSDVLPSVASSVTSKITVQNLAGTMPQVSSSISASYAVTSSFALTASYLSNYIEPFPYTGSAQITGSLGVTGSISTTQNVTASNALFTGTITAQRLVVQTISSSVIYSSGSNIFGDELTDIQQFTGSVRITGSLSLASGVASMTSSWAVSSSFALTASYALNAGGSSTFQIATGSVSASVNVVSASFRIVSSSATLFAIDNRGTVTASRAFLSSSNGTVSGSTLVVYGSGSSQPVFTVQGSQGELFSVNDSLSGSLFSVNDVSGLPIIEAFSDNRVLIGSYQAPALFTTVRTTSNSGSNVIYSVPTASYDAVFFEYSLRSGSNARAGQIMSIWSGSDTNWTETVTADFGNTTGVTFRTIITGSSLALTGSFPSASWTMKTIVRSI